MDVADPGSTISESDLTRLLPTCQRCRRLRRKCDTQLPACNLCDKAKVECTFYDHALQQSLPRSYVDSLLNRLGRLRSVQATINGSAGHTAPTTSYATYQHPTRPTRTMPVELAPPTWQKPEGVVSFDKHFIIENANPTCWQFLGSSSAYSLAVEVLVNAQSRWESEPLTHPENYTGTEFHLNKEIFESLERPSNRPRPAQAEVEALVDLYTRSTNVINGYSDPDQIQAEIQTYLRHQPNPDLKGLTGLEAHQFFRVAMICAIGAANKARHQPHFANESFSYYLEAVQCVDEVTSEISVDSLQALLLLVLYAFFYPRRGDVWKLLDYACRLSVELNFHSETNDDHEDEKERKRRRSIFWGLYSLERTFGQHVGRPSDLPEDIITVEYPVSLQTVNLTPEYAQPMLISHYYRLIYLRSEIFRILYMPALTPSLPHEWYVERLEDFNTWRDEYEGPLATVSRPGDYESMGTLQCEIGYHTSIMFLFQPLLLRALVAAREAELPGHVELAIPRQSYEAACSSIDFFSRIYSAPERVAVWSDYPMTIVSAHYIHQATLTILAHCLLALDGRIPVINFSQVRHADLTVAEATTTVDVSALAGINQKCLVLLNQLAARWTGMVGILDIYKNVADKVMPELLAGRGP